VAFKRYANALLDHINKAVPKAIAPLAKNVKDLPGQVSTAVKGQLDFSTFANT